VLPDAAAGADGGADEEAVVPVVVAVVVQPPSASTAVTRAAVTASAKVLEPRSPAEFSMRASMPARPSGFDHDRGDATHDAALAHRVPGVGRSGRGRGAGRVGCGCGAGCTG
jgi:hypothetical protein